ncbi:MAG: alpha-L-fucosidase [Chitinophagaceae bacterium]|nr:alpha-L-fucosidase [Chitinophagaceae bacterium]
MKRLFLILHFTLCILHSTFSQPGYQPAPENIKARQEFRDMKFGMFIHWGASSFLGHGEWVMNNRNIAVNEYSRLLNFFNPSEFDAIKWVDAAKSAGMKYITFITRHHDSFSNWDTKQSDWKITNTPYGNDVLKPLADECRRQGIKLFLYYSLVDWYREDYPRETGRTGKGTGRKGHGNYESYLRFMKAQLTELLTNYGEIAGIWFDGHWDQTAPEGEHDRSSRINWKYDEIYGLIHKLQPQCLIGNNHHMSPFDGEDFQMFEKDLPGQNKSGLSYQSASETLPVETCETMNDSWGFNITDRHYKSARQLIQYVVNAAGRDANFLLNIGPMPNGLVQPEFIDTLKKMGTWMQQYGETIYGTRGNVLPLQEWGVATVKADRIFLHVMEKPQSGFIFVNGLKDKVAAVQLFSNKTPLKFKQLPEGLFVYTDGVNINDADEVIEVKVPAKK